MSKIVFNYLHRPVLSLSAPGYALFFSAPIFQTLDEFGYFDEWSDGRTITLDVNIPGDEVNLLFEHFRQDAHGAPDHHTASALALALALPYNATQEMVTTGVIEKDLSSSGFDIIYARTFQRRGRAPHSSMQLLARLATASLARDFTGFPPSPYNLLADFRRRMVDVFSRCFADSFPLQDDFSIAMSLRQPGRIPGTACTCSMSKLPGIREDRQVKSWLTAYLEDTLRRLPGALLDAPWTQEAFVVAKERACLDCVQKNFETSSPPHENIRLKDLSAFQWFVASYQTTLKEIAATEWEAMVSNRAGSQ